MNKANTIALKRSTWSVFSAILTSRKLTLHAVSGVRKPRLYSRSPYLRWWHYRLRAHRLRAFDCSRSPCRSVGTCKATVFLPSLLSSFTDAMMLAVRSRRLPHLETPTLRCGTRAPGISPPGWKFYPARDSDGEAFAGRVECVGGDGAVCVWEGVYGEVRMRRSR